MARHRPQLVKLLKKLGREPIIGVEVGVHKGETSAAMLRAVPNLTLYMVDLWQPPPPNSSYWKTADPCARLDAGKMKANRQNARRITEFAKSRRYIIIRDSVAALDELPAELDFVFIDADHSYEGCMRDLHAYWPRVRPGGIFSGHDYRPAGRREKHHTEGVVRAVDEFFAEKGLEFSVGDGTVWWVWK